MQGTRRWRFGRRLWASARRSVLRGPEALVALVTILASPVGLAWLTTVVLVAATVSGWLQTPLQGVVRGYAYRLDGNITPANGLANAPRLLSFALPCMLAVGTLWLGRWGRRVGWLPRHAGAALILTTLSVPVVLVARRLIVIEDLVDQNVERDALRGFASFMTAYSGRLPALDLPGTATLVDRATTVAKLLGYGWWFALAGGVGMIAAHWTGRRHPVVFTTGWAAAALLVLGAITAPAIVAEVHRHRAERAYASGRYDEALRALHAALEWMPDLRENAAFQYRLGATRYWLGDRGAPAARLFLAQNLENARAFEKAASQLDLALADEPRWRLARRRLARLHTAWGIALFRAGSGGAVERWQRAVTLDDGLILAPYALTHALHRLEGTEQRRAIAAGSRVLALGRDKVLLADAYALVGDCYFKAGREAEARQMYRASLKTVSHVKRLNLQAQEGLLGL